MSKKLRILNLFAGLGGNRALWGNDHEIVAIELDTAIAEAYQDRFPGDEVITTDAKQYLLDNYKEYDIVWASPPCQTHTQIRLCSVRKGACEPVFPDMSLWEMIIFLDTYLPKHTKFVVENVRPFYKPLITPSAEIDRHLYWSNFLISEIKIQKDKIVGEVKIADFHKLGLKDTGIKNKIQAVRNQVNYETGKHILDCAMGTVSHRQDGLF